MGRTTKLGCRVRYLLALDDIGEARGRSGRSNSQLMFAYGVLEWRNMLDFDPVTGEHRRMGCPRWAPIRFDLVIHPKLARALQDLVESADIDAEYRGNRTYIQVVNAVTSVV